MNENYEYRYTYVYVDICKCEDVGNVPFNVATNSGRGVKYLPQYIGYVQSIIHRELFTKATYFHILSYAIAYMYVWITSASLSLISLITALPHRLRENEF
jgi:hypothetical protein